MTALRDFRLWFDGWHENIEERPSQKQWDRLKDRILALPLDEAPGPQSVIAQVGSAAHLLAPPGPPKSEAQWVAQFKGHLISQGYDPDSANEMVEAYKEDHPTIDVGSDPVAAANSAHGASMN